MKNIILSLIILFAFSCDNLFDKKDARKNETVKTILELSRYGNFCGDGSIGKEPIDSLDLACQDHDLCFRAMGKTYANDPICQDDDLYVCDVQFVDDLKQLNPDSTKWEFPPIDNTKAETYRLEALILFEGCTGFNELLDQLSDWKDQLANLKRIEK